MWLWHNMSSVYCWKSLWSAFVVSTGPLILNGRAIGHVVVSPCAHNTAPPWAPSQSRSSSFRPLHFLSETVSVRPGGADSRRDPVLLAQPPARRFFPQLFFFSFLRISDRIPRQVNCRKHRQTIARTAARRIS